MLAELFSACDDDSSGALSHAEFGQIFANVDEATRQQFGGIIFGQADEQRDGKVSKTEFVTFCLSKVGGLGDDEFKAVCEKLTKEAQAIVAIDKEAAVVDESAAPETGAPAVKKVPPGLVAQIVVIVAT